MIVVVPGYELRSPGLSVIHLQLLLESIILQNAPGYIISYERFRVIPVTAKYNTVTSILGDCATWNGLPGCNEVTWVPRSSPSMSSGSGSGPSTSTSTTSSIVPIPTPGEAFVLHGQGIYNSMYVQFDDNTGRAVLANIGTSRFVSFRLDEENNGLLQNAQDPTELVFAHLNSSANSATFAGESKRVRSVLREVHYAVGVQDSLTRSDYLTKWFWNSTTGALELSYNGRKSWEFYQVRGSSSHRKRAPSFYLYLLPAGFTVPRGSSMEKVLLAPKGTRRYSSLLSSASPTPTTRIIFSGTIGLALISSASSTSSPATSISSTSTSSESSSSPSSIRSSSNAIDAYDAITQFGLENFCTEFLSYTAPVAIATVTSTSYSTSYYAAATEASTEVTSTNTVGRSTSVTIIPTRRRSIHSEMDPLQFQERATPDQLTMYANESISSACSKVLASLSSTSTTTAFADTVVAEEFQSTLITSTVYEVATTTVDVVAQTASNVGYVKLITPDNVKDPFYPYFGLFLVNYRNRVPDPGTCGRVLASVNPSYLHTFNFGYSTTADAHQFFLNSNCVMGFVGRPPVSNWTVHASKAALNLWKLDSAHKHVPFYWQYNATTGIARPDYDKMPEVLRGGTFWICVTFPALYSVYFYPALSDLNGYKTDICSDTGMNHLLFTPTAD
ncbi:hypothetical protein TWF103_006755 [Orbilia oligospora]|uniref:Uncharacterized protein n=1 Tax=Orbilia oligospora TaxID=2813651 RepID=A0A7C8NYU8_ORBOL|nr:hypothetical protein TWF103_006755 [Orbilia oligospora]KAF3141323.1 hypothetical protein TWF703_002119 [Orbilia oligospora]